MGEKKIEKIKEWDKNYHIHTFANEKTYQPIVVDKTEGNYFFTSDGKKYLDFSSQLVCVNLGNSNEKIIAKVTDALKRYGFLWDKYATEYRSLASQKIIEEIPGVNRWAGKVKFFSSGSETIEAAVSLAKLIKNKTRLLIKEYDFHGWTSEALKCTTIKYFGSLKDIGTNEIVELPSDDSYVTIPSPLCWRCKFGKCYPACKENGVLHCIRETEKIISEAGAGTIAAYLGETVSGFGMVIPPAEYLPQLRDLLNKYDILWINDEVQTGFGRLGKWFAYDLYDGIYPDIMCIGKGLVNSVIPCGAIVVSKEIAKTLEDKIWYLGSTFSGHPAAMAAAVATIEYMIENEIVEKAYQKGEYLRSKMEKLAEKYQPHIAVSGYGLYMQLELLQYKTDTRIINVNNAYSPAKAIMDGCYQKGLVLGGLLPYSIRLAPALTVTTEEIDQAVRVLDGVFKSIFEEGK